MQFNPATVGRPRIVRQSPARKSTPSNYARSTQASAEIHAFIAARDMALVEAERQTSDMTLNRAFLANELVENCLQPARSPYQAQCLPEADASRERNVAKPPRPASRICAQARWRVATIAPWLPSHGANVPCGGSSRLLGENSMGHFECGRRRLKKIITLPALFPIRDAQNRAFYLQPSATKSVFYETAIALP